MRPAIDNAMKRNGGPQFQNQAEPTENNNSVQVNENNVRGMATAGL